MSNDLVIHQSRQLSGTEQNLDRIIVYPGALITHSGHIELSARGDIYILGSIVASAASSILLLSTHGSIYIWGLVQSGNGRHGVGGGSDGEAAGQIKLISGREDIDVSGVVRSGTGGNGADNINGSRKRGGNGKDGGIIMLNAPKIRVKGRIISGDGGTGGSAIANEFSRENLEHSETDRPPPKPTTTTSEEPIMIDGELESDEYGGKVLFVQASGGSGGNGGKIHFRCERFESHQRSRIQTGSGNTSGVAIATGGINSEANGGQPGYGGDIEFQARDQAPQNLDINDHILVPGSGGDAFGAIAAAKMTASATALNGGDGGRVINAPQSAVHNPSSGGISHEVIASKPGEIHEQAKRDPNGVSGARGATVDVQ